MSCEKGRRKPPPGGFFISEDEPLSR
jgi:hypothetical protein